MYYYVEIHKSKVGRIRAKIDPLRTREDPSLLTLSAKRNKFGEGAIKSSFVALNNILPGRH